MGFIQCYIVKWQCYICTVLIKTNICVFSTFASKFLEKLTNDQLTRYDSLINKPTNDWEIYYWAIGTYMFTRHGNTPVKFRHAYTPLLYSKTGVYIIFLINALKHRLLIRTA